MTVVPLDSDTPPWGTHSINLCLPAVSIAIRGLSREQYRVIASDYRGFVSAVDSEPDVGAVVCHVGRLRKSESLPAAATLYAGSQYSPITTRDPNGMVIAGFNFLAHLSCNGETQATASLQVAEEQELSRAIVIENFLRILVAHRVLTLGGVLLHSVGVSYKGLAYLFSGRSNSGKSTLARKAAAEGGTVLSDDINLVLPEEGAHAARKVPFTGDFARGKENLAGPGSVPLGCLALLEQAPALRARRVAPAEAVAGLLTGCPFVNTDPAEFPVLLDILTDLAARVPVVRVGIARHDSFEAVMDAVLESVEEA